MPTTLTTATASAPAAASLHAVASSIATTEPTPLILVDESCCTTHLRVSRFHRSLPLDERHVEITPQLDGADPTRDFTWQSARFSIIDAQRLIDASLKRPVLAMGRFFQKSHQLDTKRVNENFTLLDDWTDQLNQTLTHIWTSASANATTPITTSVVDAKLRVGPRANRSTSLATINNTSTYTLTTRGQVWTIAHALTYLNAIANLQLNLARLPTPIAATRLTRDVSLNQPLRDILTQILSPAGLIIQRDISRTHGLITEYRLVKPLNRPRPIRLPISQFGGTTRITSQPPVARAQQIVGRADGWLIESTFELAHGWDADLENQTSTNYSRSSNPDFDIVADVYRNWVLNEDNAYDEPAFDLATYFDDPSIAPQPLRFEPNVTLDAAGLRRSVIIEISLNAGTDWQIYDGSSVVLTNRAGVYFNDATLSSAFLTAALAGNARVRVTASLRSPSPVIIARWRGNPFAGTSPPVNIEVGQAFRFQRVATTSRAYADVQAGNIPADEIDDTADMTQWIIHATESIGSSSTQTHASAVLPGAWPMLQPGDRLLDAQPSDTTHPNHFLPWQTHGSIVQSIDVRYDHDSTTTQIDAYINPMSAMNPNNPTSFGGDQ